MIINHDREKFLYAIIYFVTNTKFCGITKLFKLLYYLDFRHFKQTGRSVTGLDYFAWKRGPVPQTIFFEIKKGIKSDFADHIRVVGTEDRTNFVPLKKFDNTHFSKRELKLLEEISFIFKDAKAEDISEATHLHNKPWGKTIKLKGKNKKIDYIFAIDDTKDSLSLEEVNERINEIEENKKAFG
jgi:uncharacterized phage-associated protein